MATKKKKKTPTKKRKNKGVECDGFVYSSKAICDFHHWLKKAVQDGAIKLYKLPVLGDQGNKKTRAKKCMVDDYIFDSMMEARFYVMLKYEQQKGDVIKIELQPQFTLLDKFKKLGKAVRAITYRADFWVTRSDGKQYLYDVKGFKTDVFRLKKKLFDHRYPDIELICITYKARTQQWVEV